MSTLSLLIFYSSLIGSLLILVFFIDLSLISLPAASLIGLAVLSYRRFYRREKVHKGHWFAWTSHLLITVSVFVLLSMVLKNIC